MPRYTVITVTEFEDIVTTSTNPMAPAPITVERQRYRIEGAATPAQLLSLYRILNSAPRKRRKDAKPE